MAVRQATLKQLLQADPDASSGNGATADEIAIAQRDLGILFPEAFRLYLSEFGYLSIGSSELYGLGTGVPEWLHLVRNVLKERNEFHPNIPVHLLPIMANGAGDHYCLSLIDSLSDPPVVLWDHELDIGQPPLTIADKFSTWLFETVSRAGN